MFRITTVCTGNICRSPLAEYMLRAALEEAGIEGVEIDSAGTSDWEIGNPIDPRAGALLTARNIDAARHTARQFTAGSFAGADLVLALDTDHYAELRRLAPTAEDREKVVLLRSFDPAVASKGQSEQGIYDPWYGDEADFNTCQQLIGAALPGLLEHIRTKVSDARGA